MEGASLHQERGGATIIARYAFNELDLVHRGLGDHARLRDPDRPHGVHDHGLPGRVLGRRWATAGSSSCVAVGVHRGRSTCINVRGLDPRRFLRFFFFALVDLGVQVFLLVVGLIVLFDPTVLTDPVRFGGDVALRGPRLRVPAGDRRLHRAGRVVGLRRPGRDRPQGPQAPARRARRVAGGRLRRAGAGGVLDDRRRGRARTRGPTRRCSAWSTAIEQDAAARRAAATSSACRRRWCCSPPAWARCSACRGSATRWPSTGRSRRAIGRLHPTLQDAGRRHRDRRRARRSRWCSPRTPSSSARSTRSARRSRSRSSTCRCSCCAAREPDRDRPFRDPVQRRAAARCRRCSARCIVARRVRGRARRCTTPRAGSGRCGCSLGIVLYVAYRRGVGQVAHPAADGAGGHADRARPGRAPSTARSSCRSSATPLDDDIMQTAGRLAAEERPDDEEDEGAQIEAMWVMVDPDVAAARRPRARTPTSSTPASALDARQGGRRGVRRRRGQHRSSSARAARGRRSCARPSAAASRRS